MKITVEFDNEEEFKARIKNPRGGKGDEIAGNNAATSGLATSGLATSNTQAPAPLMPPVNQPPFNPQAQPAFQPAAFVPPAGDPVVAGLVQRISARIDGAIASGQKAEDALTWFRGQCGAEAAAATMDQIKTVFLPRMAVPGLENIAKLMAA